MKRLFLFLPAILFAISVSAQNKTIRVGLFKRWYIGAFEEVTGKYSLAIDTATYDFEKYDEEEAAFWEEQYDHYYSGPFDSLRLIITKDLIIFDNEVFNAVYTVRAKPKYPYYYIAARNNRNVTLSIIIFPDDPAGWQIYISDSDKREWGGIWTRVPLTDGSLFFSQRRKDAKTQRHNGSTAQRRNGFMFHVRRFDHTIPPLKSLS